MSGRKLSFLCQCSPYASKVKSWPTSMLLHRRIWGRRKQNKYAKKYCYTFYSMMIPTIQLTRNIKDINYYSSCAKTIHLLYILFTDSLSYVYFVKYTSILSKMTRSYTLLFLMNTTVCREEIFSYIKYLTTTSIDGLRLNLFGHTWVKLFLIRVHLAKLKTTIYVKSSHST